MSFERPKRDDKPSAVGLPPLSGLSPERAEKASADGKKFNGDFEQKIEEYERSQVKFEDEYLAKISRAKNPPIRERTLRDMSVSEIVSDMNRQAETIMQDIRDKRPFVELVGQHRLLYIGLVLICLAMTIWLLACMFEY